DRAEQERNQQRDEEQEDDVTDRARHHPQKKEHQRQPDELDPARDQDLRRPGGHASDRTAVVVPLRPPAWDWDWLEEGNLALARDEIWEERRVRPRVRPSRTRRPPRLPRGRSSVTVP